MTRLPIVLSLVLSTLVAGHAVAENRIEINPDLLKPLDLGGGGMPNELRNKGCTFYDQADKKGQSFRVTVNWKAGEQPGHRVVFAESMGALGDWWNDKVASVACDSKTFGKPEVECEAVLYNDADFKGGFFKHKGWERAVRNLKDKTASSVKVMCSLYS